MNTSSTLFAARLRKAVFHPRLLLERVVPTIMPMLGWRLRGFAAPSPDSVKRIAIIRNGIPNGIWVETGTYRGGTTRVLAKHAKMVYSIEPEAKLFANARRRFAAINNVVILNGTSEEVLPTLLTKLDGDVSFWLDGHYSRGVTFMGPQDTPIREELASIAANLSRFERVAVLIDDIRLFNSRVHVYGAYPALDELVDWTRGHGLEWHIEHDIFIARSR